MSSLIEQLGTVGFTEYEAKVYVALQRCSPATGYQVAKESGVPRSTIYEVLSKLIARGAAVTQSLGDMVRYTPVPPDLVLDRMRHEFEDTLDNLADALSADARLDDFLYIGDVEAVAGDLVPPDADPQRRQSRSRFHRHIVAAADVAKHAGDLRRLGL